MPSWAKLVRKAESKVLRWDEAHGMCFAMNKASLISALSADLCFQTVNVSLSGGMKSSHFCLTCAYLSLEAGPKALFHNCSRVSARAATLYFFAAASKISRPRDLGAWLFPAKINLVP